MRRILLLLILSMVCIVGAFSTTATAEEKYLVHDDIFSITFPSEKHGWAAGRWGTILHTKDGGDSWTRQDSRIDTTLVAVDFADRRSGWAVGVKGTIVHTSDGGTTWTKQACPVDYLLMDVTFVSAKKGWVVTEQTHILATTDGGSTWMVQFAAADFILRGVSFCDAFRGWAVGEYGYIYHTTDGGETWEEQAGYFDVDEDGELVGDPSLYDVVAIDAETAWAVGLDGHVIFTKDGGKAWKKVDVGAPNVPLYCIEAGAAGSLVLGGKGICLSSLDGGRSWKPSVFEPSIRYTWIYTLAHRGSSHFAAGGESGIIYLGKAEEPWKRVLY
jgi:photosystem II stability/assembly factor-like uncharacterized protein